MESLLPHSGPMSTQEGSVPSTTEQQPIKHFWIECQWILVGSFKSLFHLGYFSLLHGLKLDTSLQIQIRCNIITATGFYLGLEIGGGGGGRSHC